MLLATEFTTSLIAARHQHVGDRLLERLSLRDREQMRLALGADVGDQGVRLEPLGLPQDRAGDLDRIVEGEFVDDIDRGIVEAGQPLRELRAGRDFDLVREPSDHLAEGPDLVVAIAAGDHQIGGMPQRPQRLSAVPRETASSRSLRNDFTSPILADLKSQRARQSTAALEAYAAHASFR